MNHLGMKSQAECLNGLFVHFIGAPPLEDVANKKKRNQHPKRNNFAPIRPPQLYRFVDIQLKRVLHFFANTLEWNLHKKKINMKWMNWIFNGPEENVD